MLDTLRRSLRFKLSLWGALVIFAFAAGTGLYLYASMQAALARGIQRDVDTTAHILFHKLAENRDPIDKELLDVGDHLSIRILRTDGTLALESPGMEALAPARRYPASGESWVWSEGDPALGYHLRILTAPFPGGWFQVVRNADTEEALLRRFRLSLGLVLAVLPFLAFFTGRWGVQRGLRPLQAMASQADAIRPETLGSRLALSGIPIELEPLAQAINATLGRLEFAFARLSRLNGEVAHELRSPLHALRLELEGILQRPGLPPDLGDHLGDWLGDVDHLISVIEQMLFLAQTEDPTLLIHKESVPASALLQTTLRPFLSAAEDRGIQLSVRVPKGAHLSGDPTLLRRALHNLVANALRHSPDGGRIDVEVTLDPCGPALTVRDEGPGFPPEILSRVGQRFLRDANTPGGSGGAGLGLAIAAGIAQLHGGELAIQNLWPRGTQASLSLGL